MTTIGSLFSGVDADRPRPRIAALGNAVVPQCAEVIGHIILELSR